MADRNEEAWAEAYRAFHQYVSEKSTMSWSPQEVWLGAAKALLAFVRVLELPPELAKKDWRAPPRKCLVKGCKNHEDAGIFKGELCMPCYEMLTTGKIHPAGNTFISKKEQELRSLREFKESVYAGFKAFDEGTT